MTQREPHSYFSFQAIVDRPRVYWPNDAQVAVWVIPNRGLEYIFDHYMASGVTF